MKFKACTLAGGIVKGEVLLQVDEEDAKEFELPADGNKFSCYVLTKPGDALIARSSVALSSDVEEFVDVVVDGVLRATSVIKKGAEKGKKATVHKPVFEKVLFYRYENGKKKGLKVGPMEATARENVSELPGTPLSTVGTIQLQFWRKYPEDDAESTADSDSDSAAETIKRAPNFEESHRWSDLKLSTEASVSEFEVGLSSGTQNWKVAKDRLLEERDGFKFFASCTFRLASSETLRKMDLSAPTTTDLLAADHVKSKLSLEVLQNPEVKGDEIMEQFDAINSRILSGLLPEASNESLEKKKPIVLGGMPGGPANKAVKGRALTEERRSAPSERELSVAATEPIAEPNQEFEEYDGIFQSMRDDLPLTPPLSARKPYQADSQKVILADIDTDIVPEMLGVEQFATQVEPRAIIGTQSTDKEDAIRDQTTSQGIPLQAPDQLKRKSIAISGSDINAPNETQPRKRSTEDFQRRTLAAQARLAAAREEKQRLVEETIGALAYEAEGEKVLQLEMEALEMERGNEEAKSKIAAIYASMNLCP